VNHLPKVVTQQCYGQPLKTLSLDNISLPSALEMFFCDDALYKSTFYLQLCTYLLTDKNFDLQNWQRACVAALCKNYYLQT